MSWPEHLVIEGDLISIADRVINGGRGSLLLFDPGCRPFPVADGQLYEALKVIAPRSGEHVAIHLLDLLDLCTGDIVPIYRVTVTDATGAVRGWAHA